MSNHVNHVLLQWVTHTPEGSFPVVCNGEHYANMIRSQGGEEALRQWKLLEDKMRPLQQGAALFPAAALRSDPGTGYPKVQIRVSNVPACSLGFAWFAAALRNDPGMGCPTVQVRVCDVQDIT